VDRSHIINTATGAVTLAVAAPVVISIVSLVNLAWPVIPLLAVGAIFLAANKTKSHEPDINSANSANHSSNDNRDRA
jgi:hypothetical protein